MYTENDSAANGKLNKFTVAICGGGIAGLVFAIALQQMSSGDVHIDIYESTQKFTEVGAGVALYKRPWKVLKDLGLRESLGKLTKLREDEDAPMRTFELRKADQPEGLSFYNVTVPMGILTFHRAEFQQVLASRLDPEVVATHFSKRLVSYSQELPSTKTPPIRNIVTLSFNDGTIANCDVLIGADGIHSATRYCLLREAADLLNESNPEQAKLLLCKADPVWSGSVAYRSAFPSETLRRLNPEHGALKTGRNYMGRDKHHIVFPITYGSKDYINVVAFRSWPEKEGTAPEKEMIRACTKEEVREEYIGWEEEVQQLIECMENPTKWSINALQEVPICVHGHVALIGDAAHAMTPHHGSGAGQAIEDAYILAALLAHPKTTLSTLAEALKVYEDVRLPHANDVQRRSRLNGKLYELVNLTGEALPEIDEKTKELSLLCTGPREVMASDTAKLVRYGDAIMANIKWTWSTDVGDDLKRALNMLEERLV